MVRGDVWGRAGQVVRGLAESFRDGTLSLTSMQGQSIDSQARAADRLFVAVVNQAILDVLEHGEEAEDAERWLLSKDLDVLQILYQ
jgi:hypothetical protein